MIRWIAPLFFSVSAVSFVHAQRAMSLDDCLAFALENHPEITLAQLDIRDADWQIKENTAVALPQFTAGVNYQHFLQQPAIPADAFGFEADPGTKLTFALRNNLSGTIGVNQLIFNNTYLLGIKAAREYRKYVDLKLEAAKAKLRNAVTDAYLPALLLTENITVLDKNIDVQHKLYRETQEVNKAGFAEQLDVDRLEYILSSLQSDRDNLLRQRELLIHLLQFAMHMPVSEEIALTDDLEGLLEKYASVNPAEELDLMQRPEYVSVLKARELSEIQVDIYDKSWLPTLAGFAQYQPSYQGNDQFYWIPSAIIGLQLNIPIYDGGYARAKKGRAIVTAEQVDVQKKMLENAYALELESARKQFENARTRVENAQKNLNLAQRIYDTAQTKFQAGVGSSIEIAQAQTELYISQGSLSQARFELLQARVAVKKALGK